MDLTMGFSTKFSRSSSEYKNNANMEYGNFRQLKQQDNLNIRKNKKDQQFKMKRGMADSTTHVDMMDIHKAISAFLKPSSDQQQMDTMTNIIYCLSVEGVDEVATKAIIQGGVLRHLVSLLQSENQDWVYAAIWSLVNITATNFTKEVAEHCAVPALITHLCNNPSPEIRELAAWCLANIAGDGAELRDLVMAEGALQPLFNNLNDEDNLSVTRQAIWCLSVLTWKPMDERFGIPIALKLMSALRWLNLNPYSADYVQSANNILLASSKLTEGGVRTVDAILGCEVIPFFVGLLKDNPFELNKAYAVQTLANIVAGTEAQTQAVIDAGILAFLPSLLDFDEVKDIRKDAAWICSNVAAGSTTQVDALVVTSRILESLVFIGMEDLLSIRQEATWALANLCVGNGRKYIPQLVRVDGLGPLVAILSTPHVGEEMLCDVLDALCTVLKDCGDARYIIEEFEGPDLLGDLANDFAGQSIGHKAAAVLRFFSHDLEGAEDENLAPKTAGEMFAFGMDKTPGANEKQQLYSFGDSSNALD